ncbi:MAG: DUF885 family protein, partial [Chitinophagaceae bacterium]
MKHLLFPLAVIMLMTSCNNSDTTNTTTASGNGSADAGFQKITDDFLKGYLQWRPLNAVSLGFHEYDGQAPDYSKASLDAEYKRLKEYEQKLEAVDTASLSTKMFYDYRILLMGIKNEVFTFEDQKSYLANPMVYAQAIDVNLYIKRNFAPLEQRLLDIISVEEKIPAMYEAGKTNLADSLPKPFIETAIAIADGSVSFLNGDLLVALKEVKNDSMMAHFKEVNTKAIDAAKSYIAWLKKEKLPKGTSHYALGTAAYKKMLLYSEGIKQSPEEVLAVGLAELKREQERFNAAAKLINPNKKPVDVYHEMQKEHPTAESLIPDAKKNLELIRQFIIDKNIVTMPSEVRVQVKETPEYARSLGTASMDVPGAFEKKATEAYYYITPVDPKWTAQQKEDWLSSFDFYTTDNVTIHEAYPGHYTQFLHLNASSATMIEKIF